MRLEDLLQQPVAVHVELIVCLVVSLLGDVGGGVPAKELARALVIMPNHTDVPPPLHSWVDVRLFTKLGLIFVAEPVKLMVNAKAERFHTDLKSVSLALIDIPVDVPYPSILAQTKNLPALACSCFTRLRVTLP